MSLIDKLVGIIDNVGLREVFHCKDTDLKSLRAPLVEGIERSREQFGKGAKGPNRWWSVKNDVVALTVKVRGDMFDINGVTTNHMPEERFPELLDYFRAAVDAGEFDAALINHGEGTAEVRIGKQRKSGISAAAAKARGAKSAASRKANRVSREADASSKSYQLVSRTWRMVQACHPPPEPAAAATAREQSC